MAAPDSESPTLPQDDQDRARSYSKSAVLSLALSVLPVAPIYLLTDTVAEYASRPDYEGSGGPMLAVLLLLGALWTSGAAGAAIVLGRKARRQRPGKAVLASLGIVISVADCLAVCAAVMWFFVVAGGR